MKPTATWSMCWIARPSGIAWALIDAFDTIVGTGGWRTTSAANRSAAGTSSSSLPTVSVKNPMASSASSP
ncbi:MAG: hypothetical protein R2755_33360 [Acidimicrobiales bacterium]